MTDWEMLNIEPTEDKEEIRAAYYRALPRYHPEEDPEGFARLRESYERLMGKGSKPFLQLVPKHNESQIDDESLNQWMERVKEAYGDFSQRIQPETWAALIQDEVCASLDSSKEAGSRLMGYLTEHRHIPHTCLAVLERHFNWTAKEEELCELFPENSVNGILSHVKHPDIFRYPLFAPVKPEKDYDQFIDGYMQMVDLVEAGEIEKAVAADGELQKLGIDHPDYLILQIRLALAQEDFKLAKTLCDRLTAWRPDDAVTRYSVAYYHRLTGEPEKAIDLYQKILEDNPEHAGALMGLADVNRLIDLIQAEEETRELFRKEGKPIPQNLQPFLRLPTRAMLEEALSCYRRAQAILPYDPHVKECICGVCLMLAEHCRLDCQKDMENPELWIRYAKMLEEAGYWGLGISCLEQMPAQGRNGLDYLLLMGSLEKGIEEWDQALDRYSQVISLLSASEQPASQEASEQSTSQGASEAPEQSVSREALEASGQSASSETSGQTASTGEFEQSFSPEVLEQIALAYESMSFCRMKQERFSEALDLCQKGLILSPDHLQLLCRKAEIFNRMKRHREAAALCSQGIALCDSALESDDQLWVRYNQNPEPDDWDFDLAAQALKLEDRDSQIRNRALARKLLPLFWHNKAEAFYKTNASKQALDACEQALAAVHNPETYMIQVRIYYSEKRYDRVLEVTERMNEQRILSSEAAIYMMKSLRMLGHCMAAKDLGVQIIEQDPNDEKVKAEVLYQMALVEQAQNNLELALKLVKKSLALVPDEIYRRHLIGDIYRNKSDFKSALEVYHRILEDEPDSTFACVIMAMMYQSLEDPEQAEQYYRKALEIDPDYRQTHYWLAELLASQGRYEEALEQINLQMALGWEEQYFSEKAKLLRKLERNEEAMETLKVGEALYPSGVTVLLSLAIVQRDEGNTQESIRYFERVLEMRPEEWEVWETLSQVYWVQLQDYAKARECLEKALQFHTGEKERRKEILTQLVKVCALLEDEAKLTEYLDLLIEYGLPESDKLESKESQSKESESKESESKESESKEFQSDKSEPETNA